MTPADAEALKMAILWVGAPIGLAFVTALAAHMVMVFKLPGKLDRVTEALEDETHERQRENRRLQEILSEIKEILQRHSATLGKHGERIAGLEAGRPS